MLTTIQDAVKLLLPARKKSGQNGWISFNAPCCQHNGETADHRSRGGLKPNPDGSVSFHCFNCGFTASYQPGRHLTYKFRKFLSWLGASENEVRRLVIDALRIKDLVGPAEVTEEVAQEINFVARQLPAEARSFMEYHTFYSLKDAGGAFDVPDYPDGLIKAISYVYDRSPDFIKNYDFYWTPEVEHKLSHRVIIPFYWKGQVVGYTARAIEDGIKPKYYSDHPADFVFNVDRQHADSKFVIVCEGPIDAMSVDGVSVQGAEISEQQADIIDSLGREVIVVPDFDINGKRWSGESMINHALEYGWSVSFPLWSETCKDINEAVGKYGKLAVLYDILHSVENSRLKIQLKTKKLHG